MDIQILNGFVLAGGQSKRFGSNKLFHDIGNGPILKHVIGTLHPICQSVTLVGNHEQLQEFELVVLRDQPTFHGPMAGIASILLSEPKQPLLWVAGDMPYLTVTGLNWYLEQVDRLDEILVPVTEDGFPQWIHIALKPVHVLMLRNSLVEKNQTAIHQLIRAVGYQEIQVPKALNGHFRNVNHRSDLERS